MAWLKGALGGLAIACAVIASVQYGLPQKYGFEQVVYFLSAAPAFITLQLNLSEAMMPVAYFVYWILAGAVVGIFLFRRAIVRKIIGLVLLAGILAGHYLAYVLMGDQIQPAVQAFSKLF